MDTSKKKQSHVCGRSYVSPDLTTLDELSMKSVAMRARCNRVNDATLYLLKCKLRNRVVFCGQDKIRRTPHQSSSEALFAWHQCKYGSEKNLRRKDKS